MIENDKEHNSQFLVGCNTDWNLNHEFICWLNYWLKEYKKNTTGMIDITYHKFMYKSKQWTQEEIIDRLIELTEYVNVNYYEYDKEKEIEQAVNEIFNLFHLVFWAMWW